MEEDSKETGPSNVIRIDDERVREHLGHIAGTRWSTKRYLNMELLRQRNAMIA
jgi:hypothetical protein